MRQGLPQLLSLLPLSTAPPSEGSVDRSLTVKCDDFASFAVRSATADSTLLLRTRNAGWGICRIHLAVGCSARLPQMEVGRRASSTVSQWVMVDVILRFGHQVTKLESDLT